MIVIVVAIIAAILGYVLGKSIEEDCPRSVLGYNCRGKKCDHDKVLLWQAELDMENQRRQKEAESRGMAYEPKTRTYYNPKEMKVVHRANGSVSFQGGSK